VPLRVDGIDEFGTHFVVLIEHDMGAVMTDRIVVLTTAKLAIGTPDEVRNKP
jgi:ABC-type branched-subunit amino acid transport system ATPase component